MEFQKKIDLRWSDLDPVGHLKHSVYYDLAASLRMEMLQSVGLGVDVMQKMGFGPILFKECCSFRREIRSGDNVTVDFKLAGLTEDMGRFAFRHEFYKEETFCARLEVIGAWIDFKKRKLTLPPKEFKPQMNMLPLTEDFSKTVEV
jgi:acyl-CoA thioester hydrolase